MLVTTILCTKCFQITNYSIPKNNASQFVLGTKAWKWNDCYLFFPIDQLSSKAEIIHAELILYRKRKNDLEFNLINKYVMYATKTFLNPYYLYANSDIASVGEKFYYQVNSDDETLCLDLTSMVAAWNSGKIPNRGCLIRHLDEGSMIAFAGMEYEETTPFLRLTYSLTGEHLPAIVESGITLTSTASIVDRKGGP